MVAALCVCVVRQTEDFIFYQGPRQEGSFDWTRLQTWAHAKDCFCRGSKGGSKGAGLDAGRSVLAEEASGFQDPCNASSLSSALRWLRWPWPWRCKGTKTKATPSALAFDVSGRTRTTSVLPASSSAPSLGSAVTRPSRWACRKLARGLRSA